MQHSVHHSMTSPLCVALERWSRVSLKSGVLQTSGVMLSSPLLWELQGKKKKSKARLAFCRLLLRLWFWTKKMKSKNSIWHPPTSETVTAIIKLYKNIKYLVRSAEGDTNFFKIKAVLQVETNADFLFAFALDYILRTSLDKHHLGFTLPTKLKWIYCRKWLTYIDNVYNIPITADSNVTVLLLENAVNDVGLRWCI